MWDPQLEEGKQLSTKSLKKRLHFNIISTSYFVLKKKHISYQQNLEKMLILCMQSLEARQNRKRLMDSCAVCAAWSY